MPVFKLGLVVGKFSPLHLGHCYLVEAAQSQCEQVLVLSYSVPELARCETDRRQRWLNACFPSCINLAVPNEILQALEVPTNDAPDPQQQAALLRLLAYYGHTPDALFASEPWVQACAQQMQNEFRRPVEPICVDLARAVVPVSASLIRNSASTHLAFLPPVVRADFAPRMVLLGGESTGKSTLALALAQALGVEAVREFGREYWLAKNGVLTTTDLCFIALRQSRLERLTAARATGWVVCDTSPLTTALYHGWLLGADAPLPAKLSELCQQNYDLTVLCADDIEHEQDGTRINSAFRTQQQTDYRRILAGSDTLWIEVIGTVQERVDQVLAAINPVLPLHAKGFT